MTPDEQILKLERDRDRLAAEVERVAAEAWDEAVRKCHALGWLHDFALSDALALNPYRVAERTEH